MGGVPKHISLSFSYLSQHEVQSIDVEHCDEYPFPQRYSIFRHRVIRGLTESRGLLLQCFMSLIRLGEEVPHCSNLVSWQRRSLLVVCDKACAGRTCESCGSMGCA
ncbi:hypothetical protein NPIL_665561 [Nephila pilipes]|uniref:Uncharacterized protein n=1 Tax=Nephila pilipes TaxID=299642 RepID=A0A8X6MKQ6_NEPPI|nr:hypothetical protein NPIL_381971 [Nephila pilipes]GFU31224.1 hypothetical protein NPIL_665561 [Nephila pilipes]